MQTTDDMNPTYGFILWIIIGALAGWIGSMIMGTNARQGGLANVLIGIVGALLGGGIARAVFGDDASNNGFITSLFVALLGACLVIGVGKVITGRRAAG